MTEKEPDIKSLLSIEKYLSILIDSYPEPIRATDLADKTGHTKAAISKIRDRLLQLCDPKKMSFEKGFVLAENFNMIPTYFIVFLLHGKHTKFLSSRFFKALVSGKVIHQKISTLFPPWAQRFSEDDTTFIINKLIESIVNLSSKDFQFLYKLATSRKPTNLLTLKFLNDLSTATKKFKLSFNNKDEFLKALYLRDKLFFLFRDIAWIKITEIKILEKLDDKTRKAYMIVYKDTADFYLRQIFEQNSESLLKEGKKFMDKDVESMIRIGVSQIM